MLLSPLSNMDVDISGRSEGERVLVGITTKMVWSKCWPDEVSRALLEGNSVANKNTIVTIFALPEEKVWFQEKAMERWATIVVRTNPRWHSVGVRKGQQNMALSQVKCNYPGVPVVYVVNKVFEETIEASTEQQRRIDRESAQESYEGVRAVVLTQKRNRVKVKADHRVFPETVKMMVPGLLLKTLPCPLVFAVAADSESESESYERWKGLGLEDDIPDEEVVEIRVEREDLGLFSNMIDEPRWDYSR